ncbi:carbamoyltransferase HypF [Thiocapsa imhoffii]|uniref:Carbamoyltransferase HypF n=1 Tax=Thiocapsa imhoffii TaxID=382777 RepID=A0A9X0WH05_9GAMM|nr:carbamoyltransferase HypF [Thiocapsa imhoffii]MBK1643987.1 carbamoyltransferase HypF [Thiocapsa imhoffii]
MQAESIRVRGLVQGVGFRPTVWRLARDCGLVGDVRNDGEGVLIRVLQDSPREASAVSVFLTRLVAECPPLARIDHLERSVIHDEQILAELGGAEGFQILASAATAAHTGIVPDAATCATCAAEIADPANRRHGYAFTNCTHCGPRLSIVKGIPYDRARTSMAPFPLCAECAREYTDPADRRFHAQPNACPVCGPRLWLLDARGRDVDAGERSGLDAITAASRLLSAGRILAIKGIGGFHLACDATHAEAVAELRRRKRRDAKPLAMMARDLDVVRGYCRLSEQEAEILASPAAPILLLERRTDAPEGAGPAGPPLAPRIAPGQSTLGMMLPYSPLHHLLLQSWSHPLVMTSGNLSEEPQCVENTEARDRLSGLADAFLLHDRDIVNRVDDSVVRFMAGEARVLRRARGYAPTPLGLPPGFARTPPLLALGGELKNTICLVRDGQAILSQHLGDLEDAKTTREFSRTISLYLELFQCHPEVLVVDAHPDYRSTLMGRDWAAQTGQTLITVPHHHAHLGSVLAENGWPLDGGPVLGLMLDGLGYGADGTLWGGEFLLGDYRAFRRLASLAPVAMPGGTRAIREPWRNLFAQLERAGGWSVWRDGYGELAVVRWLQSKPLALMQRLIERQLNSPLASSAGRLFDAVAAALQVGPEVLSDEGAAAIELEALASFAIHEVDEGYPFARVAGSDGVLLDPHPLWSALFADLARGRSSAWIAASFHRGFARALSDLAFELADAHGVRTIALSGGVFQNHLLLEAVTRQLQGAGCQVLLHRQVPANDGGLSLGQAAVAAALLLDANHAIGADRPTDVARSSVQQPGALN